MISQYEYKQLNPSFLVCKPENAPTENTFYKKKVVFTGDLQGWDRPTAACMVQSLGADVDRQISGKTQIVIIGKGAGPSKMEKIIDMLANGSSLRLMNEKIFDRNITVPAFDWHWQ